jgi:hypothetical protein
MRAEMNGKVKPLYTKPVAPIEFMQVMVLDRSRHTFMCPIVISKVAFELRSDALRKEAIYFNEDGTELMRVPFAEMPAGQWVWT